MHLFEFMDQSWLPKSLRDTLRDVLECGNSRPFRDYYDWVAEEAIQAARAYKCNIIVELGAGTAPVTRRLLDKTDARDFSFVVCDANPDAEAYRELERSSGGRVTANCDPVDFSEPRDWPPKALLILSATLHHIPSESRRLVVDAMCSSGNRVLIFEPLRNTVLSAMFTLLSLVPAALTPIRFIRRSGRIRRIVWCWLIPIAPIMFCWDGLVSCLRQWDAARWRESRSSQHPRAELLQIQERIFTQLVVC